MVNPIDVLITISVLVLMIVPGYALTKLKLTTNAALPAMSSILLYVCQPFLTFKVFVLADIDNRMQLAANMSWMALVAFCALMLAFVIAKLTFFKFKDKEKAKIYTFASMFSNCGFIGIPIVGGITNNNPVALIYTSVFIVIFNLMLWTMGVYIITGNIRSIKPAKIFLNPPTLAFFIALPFFFLPQINIFRMHTAVSSFVGLMGDMTTPLSMFIVGIRLAYIPLKEVFTHWKGYIMVALKQAVIPLICFGLLYPFARFGVFKGTGAEYIVIIAVVMMSLPTAASTLAFCERYGGDARTATMTFMQSTITSIATLPLVLMILSLL